MTRTIAAKNVKIHRVNGELRLTVDRTEQNPSYPDDRSVNSPSNSDLRVTLEPAHVSNAGNIFNLVAGDIGSTSVINSLSGTVRSNHYHLTDWHFLYVVSGLMYYYWRPFRGTNPQLEARPPVERIRCRVGDMMWTPPMVEHATYFPEETTLVAVNGRARDHHSHEEDVRRVSPMISVASLCPAVLGGIHCVLPFENTKKDVGQHYHNGPHEDAAGNTFTF